jgi:hypothetical protein
MLKIAFLLFLITANAFPQNARAILKVLDNTETLTVGETYSFELTIVPFSIQSIKKETFEGKPFIDYFYVTKVEQLFVSPNNEEAVVVQLKAILAKEFKPKPLYIWSLLDRNIPVEVKPFDVNSVKISNQDFVVHKTGKQLEKSRTLEILGGVIVLVIFLALFFLYRIRKNQVNPEKVRKEDLKRFLSSAAEHNDFEKIYRDRGLYLEVFKNEEGFRRKFIDFLDLYRIEQFSNQWHSKDLIEIQEASKAIFKGEDIGS